jgi:heme-degrading monooxygenase HmoA
MIPAKSGSTPAAFRRNGDIAVASARTTRGTPPEPIFTRGLLSEGANCLRAAEIALPKEEAPFMPQIHADNQPVTQITIVESDPDKQAEVLSLMKERAEFMSRQPGFISISMHRSLDGRRVINYIQWKDQDRLREAHRSPQFRKEWGHFDQLTDDIDPHLYEVAVVMETGR